MPHAREAPPAWTPLPEGATSPTRALVAFRKSRAEIERALGGPQARDLDSNGLGPMDAWAFRLPCGVEIELLAFQIGRTGAAVGWDEPFWVELRADTTDFGHVVAHLPFPIRDASPFQPDPRTTPPARWAVVHEAVDGSAVQVAAHASRCAADADLVQREGADPGGRWRVESVAG